MSRRVKGSWKGSTSIMHGASECWNAWAETVHLESQIRNTQHYLSSKHGIALQRLDLRLCGKCAVRHVSKFCHAQPEWDNTVRRNGNTNINGETQQNLVTTFTAASASSTPAVCGLVTTFKHHNLNLEVNYTPHLWSTSSTSEYSIGSTVSAAQAQRGRDI